MRLRPPGTPADLLVVGLGNPGDEYRGCVTTSGPRSSSCCDRHGGRLRKRKERARRRGHDRRAPGGAGDPTHYVNDSGNAVGALVRRFGVDPEQLVVVHDELDLPGAELKVKSGGGLAGHNGLRSIVEHLHTQDFQRVRIGVGKPVTKERGADHVLNRFGKRERAEVDVTVEQAADAVETIVRDGVDAAMNRFN